MSVCNNQTDFNKAVNAALTYSQNQNKKITVSMTVFLIIWLVLLIIAVYLATKSDPSQRVIHLFLAFFAPPLYILSVFGARMTA